ncbi:glycosyltransferase family 2 protein [Pontibacter silvestris]|uniref:Glycosyltransferase family 2 protein n=1 Tax=Pontibacter silvestris TaxID=2305183 RepID=A0ABW4X474_9BACT|nr:glycosyltransferase [Pontibacter silvestris]MCC9135073.1 glycosyltransferase family 2 protein [Pontibacter silvestris]
MHLQDIIQTLANLFSYLVMFYVIGIYSSYFILGLISAIAMADYKKKNSFVDYRSILSSKFAPSVSLIAPAYNESLTIVENVRSLLTLHYNNYEVIIINDGSKDNTMQLLIEAYELEKVDFILSEHVVTKPVRGIYKAKNPAYHKLVVVDKENGGKADALNVGINVSVNKLIACIDVDCVLEHDSLLKLVKPFMEEDRKVIATGGVIRIANSCVVEDGRLTHVHVPDKFIARVQVLEYFRAFLMGRMAWAHMDALLLISGAFGMFDKETVIKAGGYNHNTVGEDMELLVRMRRLMYEEQTPCKVAFIPDPLCWTEAPQTWNILKRQRNRWTRGTAETLMLHRKMILNKRYGILGLVSLPLWVLFEWFAPLFEFFGMLFFMCMAIAGYANWLYFFSFFSLIYSFAIMNSLFAILFEELSYKQYKRLTHMLKLIGTALLEPILYHPVTVWAAVKGNYDLITGKKSWGEMTRTGFVQKGK